MDMDAEVYRLGVKMEEYEDLTNPEDKMDMKQVLTQKLKELYTYALSLDEDEKTEALEQLDDLAEILTY